MKTKQFIAVLLLVMTFSLSGQLTASKIKIDVAPELSFPMGDLADFAGFGLGFSSRAYYQLEPTIDFTFTSGFTYYTEGEIDDSNAYCVPLKGGFRYFIIKNNSRLYALAELGFDIIGWEVEFKDFNGKIHTDSDNKVRLCFAPALGYKFDMGHSTLDVSARFEFVDDGSHFGIRAGYYLPVKF